MNECMIEQAKYKTGCGKIDLSHLTVLLNAVLISLSIWPFLLNLLSSKCKLYFLFLPARMPGRTMTQIHWVDEE